MTFQNDEPLTPEEARAFLQVHAEREASGPRVGDLAETLGLAPDEARSILAEARRRIAPRRAFNARIWLAVAGTVAVLFAILFFVGPLGRSATPEPTLSVLASHDVAPPAPIIQPALATPPAPLLAGTIPVQVPDGFEISIRVAGAETNAEGWPTRTLADYRWMSEARASEVREALVEATLTMIDNALANPDAWMRAPELWVNLRVRGGAWTLVKVPIRPFTLPLQGNPAGREGLRGTLSALYRAGWTDLLREGAPR